VASPRVPGVGTPCNAGDGGVSEAGHGRDALALIHQSRPMAVLMDVNMPVMDGVEASRALRADPATRDVPVFALTGDVSLVNQRRVAEAGVDGYLEKPVSWEDLKVALAKIQDRWGQVRPGLAFEQIAGRDPGDRESPRKEAMPSCPIMGEPSPTDRRIAHRGPRPARFPGTARHGYCTSAVSRSGASGSRLADRSIFDANSAERLLPITR
jgi:CheY-like chemotaxis protein